MAKPIAYPSAPEPPGDRDGAGGARDELRRRLERAPLEHAEALLSLWNVLEAAHESHLLEIAHGVLSARDEVLGRVADAARSEGSIRLMRNVILLGDLLASIDPDVLGALLRALPGAIGTAHAQACTRKDPPSLLRVARDLASPDARRAQGILASILGALGRALKPGA